MRSMFPEKLDSDHIRQGLLNIRNTQLQLLKQLKQQTQLLKSYSPSSTSNQSPKRSIIGQSQKTNTLSQFMKSQKISFNEQRTQEKQSIETKRLTEEINYLRSQNKLLSNNFQKLKASSQFEKQTIRDLQLAFKYSANMFEKILMDIFKDASTSQIIDSINVQVGNAEVCRPLIRTSFEHIISLIKQKQTEKTALQKSRQKIQNEKDIAIQLIELKSQISFLINSSSNQKKSANRDNQEQISTLTKQNNLLKDKIKQYEDELKSVKEQNFDLQQEKSEFKKMIEEWEKIKANFTDKEKKVIFYAKDMQNRATKAENLIKEKEKIQQLLKENSSKLVSVHSILRKDNDNLRNQILQLQQKLNRKIQLILKQKRQLQQALRELAEQKQSFTRTKQQELHSLRMHVSELKKNISALSEFDKKTKAQDVIHQDIFWKKVNIVRTNSNIDHLWQIKEIQYENIHNILQNIGKI